LGWERALARAPARPIVRRSKNGLGRRFAQVYLILALRRAWRSPTTEVARRPFLQALREDVRETFADPVPNLLAGLTVAVVALPLALAFGLIAFGPVYGPAARATRSRRSRECSPTRRRARRLVEDGTRAA
jgi:hypothetical protein